MVLEIVAHLGLRVDVGLHALTPAAPVGVDVDQHRPAAGTGLLDAAVPPAPGEAGSGGRRVPRRRGGRERGQHREHEERWDQKPRWHETQVGPQDAGGAPGRARKEASTGAWRERQPRTIAGPDRMPGPSSASGPGVAGRLRRLGPWATNRGAIDSRPHGGPQATATAGGPAGPETRGP